MSERFQVQEPLFKLVVRFSNGETTNYLTTQQIDARKIGPDIRYATIASFSCQNPSECTDVTVINMRDVTFIKTEHVTLDQLATERRMAGIRSKATQTDDEGLVKTLSQLSFV